MINLVSLVANPISRNARLSQPSLRRIKQPGPIKQNLRIGTGRKAKGNVIGISIANNFRAGCHSVVVALNRGWAIATDESPPRNYINGPCGKSYSPEIGIQVAGSAIIHDRKSKLSQGSAIGRIGRGHKTGRYIAVVSKVAAKKVVNPTVDAVSIVSEGAHGHHLNA
jgi:hypothetical protein